MRRHYSGLGRRYHTAGKTLSDKSLSDVLAGRLESSRRPYQYLQEARVALKLQPVTSPRGTAALLIEPGP